MVVKSTSKVCLIHKTAHYMIHKIKEHATRLDAARGYTSLIEFNVKQSIINWPFNIKLQRNNDIIWLMVHMRTNVRIYVYNISTVWARIFTLMVAISTYCHRFFMISIYINHPLISYHINKWYGRSHNRFVYICALEKMVSPCVNKTKTLHRSWISKCRCFILNVG